MSFPDALAATGSQLRQWDTRAMATLIRLQSPDGGPSVDQAIEAAMAVFRRVEATCSRFDEDSALSRANAGPDRWHQVPSELFDSLAEAYAAYVMTGGAFDPRVHDALVGLGYDRSFTFGPASGGAAPTGPITRPWRPRFLRLGRAVRLGPHRVDLGGIGKGLAVRWAAREISAATSNFLIDAGGDCYAAGAPHPSTRWRVGIESPAGEGAPVAVLELRDMAVGTSSVRVRSWRNNGERVHHLVDPRTGRPGGEGLFSVTVVHPDPAVAEVWSKAAFLAGSEGIGPLARSRGLAALWVDQSGHVESSEAMGAHVIWRSS